MPIFVKKSRSRGLSPEKIVSRILSLAETPRLQSELLNGVLVSRSTLSRYLSFLLSRELLEQVELEGRTGFKTTRRGNDYLRGRISLSFEPRSSRGSSSPSSSSSSRDQEADDNEDERGGIEDGGKSSSSSKRENKNSTSSAGWDLATSVV
jgi:predicted transcriptional regulator